ncbi:MAG TPA: S9 family peptidase [Gammaproteobacteria bacterium]|nr:S9 family peptidase [Gammaproteobacteria bacterium]
MNFFRVSAAHAIVFAVVLLAAGHVHGQPLSLAEIVQLRTVSSARLSPDGERIAYLLSVPREPYVDDDGGPWRELHVVDLQGRSRPFVAGEVSIRDVIWAHDGTELYYLAERDDADSVAVYAIPLDGGESRKLYEHPTNMQGLRLSPDGHVLSFQAVEERGEDYEQLQEKGFRAVVYEEDDRYTRAWLLNLESLEAEMLALTDQVLQIEWSPDARSLAAILAPTPLVDDSYVRVSLNIVDAATGEVLRRIDHAGKLGDLAWSPDSTAVAFIGAADPSDPLAGRVYVATADGEQITNLTPEYPGHVEALSWRDDDTLVYLAARGVWSEFDTLSVRGDSVLPQARAGGPIVRAFDMREGIEAVAMIADTPAHPLEVYAWTPQEGYRRLTHSNPILEERDLATQEVVRFAARDGLELEGILVRPIEARRGQRYPLIIAVHGGPESHYSNGWMSGYTFPAQTLAGDAYAVFYPNYRASTGRGVEFSKLDHGDPAGAEFDDLVDAKNYLVEIGLADADRVGVSGGSYGGYATMWSSTALTEHFAAGVAFVGISDLIGSLGTSDIPYELNEVHLRFWPWDDWQFALERSPIYHVEGARTPLLILGGDADPRVDPSQSLAMYRYMKLRTDTPVRLVQYPGEGHGNVRAAARLDYSMRMKRWMDHYLKGPGGAPPPHDLGHAEALESAGEEQ